MQLLCILKCQLGCVHGALCGVHCSLSLTNLSLVSLVVNNKQHLSGTNRLTFRHINLGQEA